jgi:signal transduction histidine kinase
MKFRLQLWIVVWSIMSAILVAALLMLATHWHLDRELRRDLWKGSHSKFPKLYIHGNYTDEEVHGILNDLLTVWLWVALPILAGSVGAGCFMAARSLHQVRRINRELAGLDPQSFAHGVLLPERDAELITLVQHINDLLRRVGRSYNEMAEFSTTVAHELRTPLTFLRLRLEALAPELPPDVSEELQEKLHRLSQYVEHTLLMAKAEVDHLEQNIQVVNFTALLDDLHGGYAILADEGGLALNWQVHQGLQVVSDQALLRQILHNLIGNALRHGQKSVSLEARPTDGEGPVIVEISNSVAAADTARLGNGMGLRLVRAIVPALQRTTFTSWEQDGVFSVKLELPGLAGIQEQPADRTFPQGAGAPPSAGRHQSKRK